MQLSNQVDWSIGDFILAATFLFATAFGIVYVSKKITSKKHRLLAVIVILTLFILFWVELAVGIFGF